MRHIPGWAWAAGGILIVIAAFGAPVATGTIDLARTPSEPPETATLRVGATIALATAHTQVAVEKATARPTSRPTLGVGGTMVSEVDGMQLVYVPAGEFVMGALEEDEVSPAIEKPEHTVYLPAFWIDQTEVTNAMFARFLNERGNQWEGGSTWYPNVFVPPYGYNLPLFEENGIWNVRPGLEDEAVEVSWYGAKRYCEWAGRCLATEAEWEKATRGENGQPFPWGNDPPNCATDFFVSIP
ncbi:MAG: SUMF1/EgtB/PvdO family nonheme iron enzyme [Chloroflexi bacterium]|nr:SUMF1/EgtB/PvdO family nonheme iron enzyme [Chloroflexota bacterium]